MRDMDSAMGAQLATRRHSQEGQRAQVQGGGVFNSGMSYGSTEGELPWDGQAGGRGWGQTEGAGSEPRAGAGAGRPFHSQHQASEQAQQLQLPPSGLPPGPGPGLNPGIRVDAGGRVVDCRLPRLPK